MSAAPAAALAAPLDRTTPDGFTRVPSSVITNMDAFTRAELGLVLMISLRGTEGANISDRQWRSWTGLDPRMKQKAVEGLQKKGLQVNGRGMKQKLSWDQSQFNAWIREQPRDGERAHTVGRKVGVEARAGAKVHPDCRESGCAKLFGCNSESAGGPQLVSVPNAKPVSQNPSSPPLPLAAPTPIRAERVVKPVSQIERLWPLTLDAGRAYFPLVGKGWLVSLVAAVREQHPAAVSDADVASAVKVAWNAKNKKRVVQDSPGLFYVTVPESLRFVIECRATGVDPLTGKAPAVEVLRPAADVGAGVAAGVRATIGAAVDTLRPRGNAFAPVVAELEQLAAGVSDDSKLDDVIAIEDRMQTIEHRLVDVAHESFDDAQRADVKAFVSARVRQWRTSSTTGRVDSDKPLPHGLELSIKRQRVLELLACPRLTLVYV